MEGRDGAKGMEAPQQDKGAERPVSRKIDEGDLTRHRSLRSHEAKPRYWGFKDRGTRDEEVEE